MQAAFFRKCNIVLNAGAMWNGVATRYGCKIKLNGMGKDPCLIIANSECDHTQVGTYACISVCT